MEKYEPKVKKDVYKVEDAEFLLISAIQELSKNIDKLRMVLLR